jgi:hypothetical protein
MRRLSKIFLLSATLLGACIHVHAPKKVVVRYEVDGDVSLAKLEETQILCTFTTLRKAKK